jgi:CBS domain-containing protein
VPQPVAVVGRLDLEGGAAAEDLGQAAGVLGPDVLEGHTAAGKPAGSRQVSAVPVVDAERRVLGVVSEADLLLNHEQPNDAFQRFLLASRRQRLERLKARGGTAAELMSWPVITISPEAEVAEAAEAARRLHKHLIRRLPVIDAAGRLVGSSANPMC